MGEQTVGMFSFGFTDEDLDPEGDQQYTKSISSPVQCPLDSLHLLEAVQPQWEDLRLILQSLAGVRISFETFRTPQGNVLYRRELFDIKHQLMTEADGSESVELDILIGDTAEDLRKNIYEGGLKSWECSIDLVDYLARDSALLQASSCVVELGCGTALPSEYALSQYLLVGSHHGLQLILGDYNKSVLRLVTLPNLILIWSQVALNGDQRRQLQTGYENVLLKDEELFLTPQLLDEFHNEMQKRKIDISFISGTWGRQFNQLLLEYLQPIKEILVLSSETIYQPENLPVVAETLLELFKAQDYRSIRALVAAKDIYFGVGGSIVDFENYMAKVIKDKKLPLSFTTFKINAGLKRSIVLIE